MTERGFDPSTLHQAASDAFTVRRVFGEAYQHEGRLVVPVARVAGATGSAAGRSGEPVNDGGVGGFATHVRPLGVVVVDEHGARWHPTVDLNRVILGGQLVGAVLGCAWALAWVLRRRR